MIPAIREVLKEESTYIRYQADLTGDGIPEALVHSGQGGAYTDSFTLIGNSTVPWPLLTWTLTMPDTGFLKATGIKRDHAIFATLFSWCSILNGK
jgi:hypothetical protein